MMKLRFLDFTANGITLQSSKNC